MVVTFRTTLVAWGINDEVNGLATVFFADALRHVCTFSRMYVKVIRDGLSLDMSENCGTQVGWIMHMLTISRRLQRGPSVLQFIERSPMLVLHALTHRLLAAVGHQPSHYLGHLQSRWKRNGPTQHPTDSLCA